jgi:DNA-binding transcriptional LysR family regulator
MYATDSPTEGRYFHDPSTGLFRAADIAPRFVQHVSQVHAILALMGVALMPRSAGSLLTRGVGLRTLRPAARTLAELHLIWRAGQSGVAGVPADGAAEVGFWRVWGGLKFG